MASVDEEATGKDYDFSAGSSSACGLHPHGHKMAFQHWVLDLLTR